MTIKLDMNKAYDYAEGLVSSRLMNFMGFDGKWLEWIKACASSEFLFSALKKKRRGNLEREERERRE